MGILVEDTDNGTLITLESTSNTNNGYVVHFSCSNSTDIYESSGTFRKNLAIVSTKAAIGTSIN